MDLSGGVIGRIDLCAVQELSRASNVSAGKKFQAGLVALLSSQQLSLYKVMRKRVSPAHRIAKCMNLAKF